MEKIDYEKYHKSNSRTKLSGFEIARWDALTHFVPKNTPQIPEPVILDYGAGAGLHIELWEKLFPSSELYLCDISTIGKEKCLSKFPKYEKKYKMIINGRTLYDNEKFDIILSIEVMEHVDDLITYIKDIFRLLKPGGVFIWTTPCSNKYSIEHIYSLLTNQILITPSGFKKWSWEDPTHVRRLLSSEINEILLKNGFSDTNYRFRSHLFSFICTYCPPKNKFQKLRNSLMKLDYNLLRKFPNGASMIGIAKKPIH